MATLKLQTYSIKGLIMNVIPINNNRLIYACWLAVLSWVLLIVALISTIITYISENQIYMVVSFSLFFTSALFYVVMATLVKCTSCAKRTLVQGFKPPKYIESNKVWGMIGWSGIVLNVLLHHKFTYMHCGNDYCISHKGKSSICS